MKAAYGSQTAGPQNNPLLKRNGFIRTTLCLLILPALISLQGCANHLLVSIRPTPPPPPPDTIIEQGTTARVSQLTQYGITFYFDAEYTAGVFANGDFWIQGPLNIENITPEYRYENIYYNNQWINRWINGWEVNPSAGTETGQGFGSEISSFDPDLVPALPYRAAPGQSILKSVRSDVPPRSDQTNRCEGCLQTIVVVTIVAEPPPGNGQQIFRPPYVASDKPYYYISDIRTELLASVAPAGTPPSLEEIAKLYQRVQIEHKGAAVGYDTRPLDNFSNIYGGAVGRNYGLAALRLMLDDPLEDKMPALINFTQMSIDFYHNTLEGRNFGPGGGHQPGHSLPLAWFAAMLGDAQAQEYVKTEAVFKTPDQDFLQPSIRDDSIALYGSASTVFMAFDPYRYWNYITNDLNPTNMYNICYPDPHGFVDGGGSLQRDYSSYQNIMNGPWRGLVTAGYIMPELAEMYNNPLLFDYVERWYNQGYLAQPDACAPSTGNMNDYGIKFGANPDYDPQDPASPSCILDPGLEYYNSPTDFKCQEGSECGRWPHRHGLNPGQENPSYASPFITAMWEAYKQP